MSLLDFSCICMFIVFAQQTESRVLILRDYDDEPLILGHVDRSSAEEVKQKKVQPISLNYKPKRTHSKKTVLQYGRHIYHLDNFADLKDLRSKMTELKPDPVSYDYVDVDDVFQVKDPTINGVGDYIKDVVIFSNTPIQICSGDSSDEDLRKNSKHKKDDDWKHKKMQFGRMKRFQVVDNRHASKKHGDSSEEYHKKKQKSTRKNKKKKEKKKRHTSESNESMSKESGSEEKKNHKKSKKKYKPPKEEKISSEESIEIKRKPKKTHNDHEVSIEKRKKHEKDSKNHEDFHKKKKNKKKNNYGVSDETTRKTFAVDDDFFMQGNKIYHAKERKSKKKHHDYSKRRRLEHFLPKRYHWESSEIHDLGYYWFNGPKGKYPAPQVLDK